MTKTIFLTGSTDGIGLEAARMFAAAGHRLLLHGRSQSKLQAQEQALAKTANGGIETYLADLSCLNDVRALARAVAARHDRLDVLINNAGVLRAPVTRTQAGLDIRFAVNTIAPFMLTRALLPAMPTGGRVINLSSAAQAPVDLDALAGGGSLEDMQAYSQSKLALTMWSRHLADQIGEKGPVVIALNPGSLLGTNMVKDAFNTAGKDIRIGAEIIVRAALDGEFAAASGRYFDNDAGCFAEPHPDARDPVKCAALVKAIEAVLMQMPE